MHPYGTRKSEQRVSGPQQNHWGYVKHMGLRDMKQHAMGSASLSTMLRLRECAFQEEGQGPRGHKAWLMAERCLLPTHENQVQPPPAFHCPLLPAAQQCTPVLPPAHSSGRATAWTREGCAAATGEGASLGLASPTKPPLETLTGETLTNVGTRIWGSRWGAGSQANKLCTLDVELDGSAVGSLLVFSAPRQVFVPWLLYRETNLLLVRQRFMTEIKALRAFIFHRIILDDFACPKSCPGTKGWFRSIYLKVNPDGGRTG